jgi:uncharacterized protein
MEEHVTFPAGDICLEGRLYRESNGNAAVITHPHPLMGGDMENGVVQVIADLYRQAGRTTLRFNFRGVGRSAGRFDEGRGEQDDLLAAIAYLHTCGYRNIDLAGYSFGAWIIARWSQRSPSHPHRILLVAPPVDFIEFDPLPIPGLQGVIVGERDAYADITHIKRLLPDWNSQAMLHTIAEADHFFTRCGKSLRETLAVSFHRSGAGDAEKA